MIKMRCLSLSGCSVWWRLMLIEMCFVVNLLSWRVRWRWLKFWKNAFGANWFRRNVKLMSYSFV